MQAERSSDLSMEVTTFFLKKIGLWIAKDAKEERIRKLLLFYTVWSSIFGMLACIRDLYFTWYYKGDVLYVLANTLGGVIIVMKLHIILLHKEEFTNLILYMQQNFWNVDYDFQEKEILKECRKVCAFFVSGVTSIGMCALLCYNATPFLMQKASNDSERMLPFNMWVHLPLSETPYYEIMFLVQAVTLFYVGICYFCFDNVFCIMAIHLSGQFRILRYRFTNLCNVDFPINNKDAELMLTEYVNRCYQVFRKCVQEHQALIDYCDRLENVYTMIILGQVLIFSALICLFGFQVLEAKTSYARRSIFVFLLAGAMFLLFMFTYSCNCVTEESEKVALGPYSAQWMLLPVQKVGMMLRNDLIMVIRRSRRVCCLTANGFFPVSLETYTTILSTAVSYFTLLRDRTSNDTET